jgi:serine/threonine-protein kinase
MRTEEVDDYEILEDQILGQGDTGILCRGRQRSAGRDVLIKLLRREIAADPEATGRLRREAESAGRLRDPSVAQVLGAGAWKGRLFWAMEPVEGQSLASYLREGHRFTTEEILHVAEGVGKALRAASRCGLVHGAIRPSHILLAHDGSVKVLDFGLTRGLNLPVDSPLLAGLWRYLAPERVTGEPPDLRSDLYSLGVVLYELATGKPPFEGYDSPTSLVYQLLYVQPASPRDLGSSIPRDLERVILRCLSKVREDRYAGPDDFLADIEAVRQATRTPLPATSPDAADAGDFEIFEDQILGEGGMGTLYRGRQKSLGREVAIKVIRGVFTTNPDFVQRFRREAELLAQVNDPAVVQVFGTGTWKGRLFYAMELVEGEDLAGLLQKGRRFTVDEILHVAEGVGGALRAAWKYKIVHRDIKPSNILLTRDGHVKVADFGLAKSLRVPRTDSHLIAGTSEYLAPEQGIGQRVDIRSDLYSLGVVLYELAAGRPPFRWEGSFTSVIYQHVHAAPPPLKRAGGDLPEELRRLIERCLAKRPEDRYPTPEAFLEEVRAIRARLQPPAGVGSEGERGAEPSAAPRRTSFLARAGLLAALAAAAYLALAGGTRLREGSRPPRTDEFGPAYELALGLGDYDAALELAARCRGRDSREFREAERLRTEARALELEAALKSRLAERDWAGAVALYIELLRIAPPERRPALERGLEYCRDLARAEELERRGQVAAALAIYRRWADAPGSHREFLRERIRALTAER